MVPLSKSIKIKVSVLPTGTIPPDPEMNTGVVTKQVLEELSLKTGLLNKLQKGILPSVGLKAGVCGLAISGTDIYIIVILNTNKADSSKVADDMEEGFKSVGVGDLTPTSSQNLEKEFPYEVK